MGYDGKGREKDALPDVDLLSSYPADGTADPSQSRHRFFSDVRRVVLGGARDTSGALRTTWIDRLIALLTRWTVHSTESYYSVGDLTTSAQTHSFTVPTGKQWTVYWGSTYNGSRVSQHRVYFTRGGSTYYLCETAGVSVAGQVVAPIGSSYWGHGGPLRFRAGDVLSFVSVTYAALDARQTTIGYVEEAA